ncbi:hypothetical protein [Neotamlana sedimentorum]|uniref:hypothetical protein n=1 Tax=Neotamlana sedimentorum TaxID=1435349 RepID=UPI000A9878CA|nr:hypothetical protein [Tamlana sedimentorum]
MKDSQHSDEHLKDVPKDIKPKVMKDIAMAKQLKETLNKFPIKMADLFDLIRGKKKN